MKMQKISNWYFAEVSAAPVVLAKISLGLILTLSYLWFLPSFSFYFTDMATFQTVQFSSSSVINQAIHCSVFASALISSVLFSLFWHLRWPGFLALITHQIFYRIYPLSFYGWAVLINLAVFHLSFVKLHHLKQSQDPQTWKVAAWPQRLIQLQVCGIYLMAALTRINNPIWLYGYEMFYFMRGSHSRFPTLELNWFRPFYGISTYIAWGLEFAAPILLWLRKIGSPFALLLIGFHLIMELMNLIGWWSHMMSVFLFCFFLPAHWSERLLKRVKIFP